MKYYVLDQEEKAILKDYDEDKFVEMKNVKEEMMKLKSYTQNTLSKTRNINIRLPQKIVVKLKAKAAAQGIPYQTLAASVLYRFVLYTKNNVQDFS